MKYSAQPRHAHDLKNSAATTINRALLPSHNSPYYERLMRQPLRQRYESGVIRPPSLLYPAGKRDSAYLYGRFSSPYLRCPVNYLNIPSLSEI
ncbi:hypothetical protein AVEN_111978-1 [Araneus ventricosus]|uniref:Uncharacterized protein n=1 Tax=Araneus ventricosus TaxID=182803 RepID=A0A4Y2NGF1_ARAVE|nr:hypothetical protein AVEN_111978-1 [Araneus ventricosus]